MIFQITKELVPLAADALRAILRAVKAAKEGDEEAAKREIVEAARHISLKKAAKEYLKK